MENITTTPNTKKQTVVNRSAVKAFALQVSKACRAGKFTRVSEEFLIQIEADTEAVIRQLSTFDNKDALTDLQFVNGTTMAKLKAKMNDRVKGIVYARVMRHPSLGCTLKD